MGRKSHARWHQSDASSDRHQVEYVHRLDSFVHHPWFKSGSGTDFEDILAGPRKSVFADSPEWLVDLHSVSGPANSDLGDESSGFAFRRSG